MQKKILTTILIIFLGLFVFAQNGVQTVKGTIIDKQAEIPLIGATIQLKSNDSNLAATSDLDGNFSVPNIPIGRQAFIISYLGYETVTIPNVEITAGKEVFLNIEMVESLVQLEEVIITSETAKDQTINEMATVSARQFSMEEVNRYSGGRSDVGRLAGNFAGVSTADDSRNDIVIRGNSPTGLLWRLEGIPIPSPNHFSTVGTTGGPVSALNPSLLKNSDFMTSAFPAEYGNALSGVFDLGFRNGNKDKVEYMFQIGAVTGIEAMIEGPISKKNNSSYIIAGRYSFLGVAQAMGLDIGTNAVPNYYDVSFKFNSGKTSLGNFTLFGVGGLSDIEFLHDEVDEQDLFAADDEDAKADSRFGVIGLKHNYLIDNQSYIRTVVGVSENGTKFSRDRYYNIDQTNEVKSPFVVADDGLQRITISSYYNRKFNKQFTLRAGVLSERVKSNLFQQSAEFAIDEDNDGIFDLIEVYRFNESSTITQPYAQAQYRLNEKITLNAGLHGMHYSLNGEIALEPRAAVNWQVGPKESINFGYGLHHQTQPLPVQLATMTIDGETSSPNQNLGFTKSNQFVLGYDLKMIESWRAKVELYYQHLSNVPVDRYESSFSMLNVGADFGFPIDKNNLVNEGTGRNHGLELTIEKFFDDGYYALVTVSMFESKYKGSDGKLRNTAFNNQRVMNVLAGREFKWGKQKQHRFTIDTKLAKTEGRYYTPVDLEASQVNGIEVYDESKAFSKQYDPYFRWDVKIGAKFNNVKRKFSQAIFFDIQNVTNNENIFRKSYNRVTNEVNDILQIGFFPNFIYKVEF